MATKSNAKEASSGAITVQIPAKQARLLQNKAEVVQKARDLQVELARVRAEMTRIDQEMLKAGFMTNDWLCW